MLPPKLIVYLVIGALNGGAPNKMLLLLIFLLFILLKFVICF